MFNCSKKFISVLLCIVLVFTTASVAFAAEDVQSETLETDFTCYYFSSIDVVVVTLDGKYTQIGEVPEVLVYSKESDSETVDVTEVNKDKIQMEIYKHYGVCYPQIFINIDFDSDVVAIEIGDGAFLTEAGEKSAKVEVANSAIQFGDFGISCEYLAYCQSDDKSDWLYYNAIVGNPIKISSSIESEYAEMWRENTKIVYTFNGETNEINSDKFVPEEEGEYIFEIKLNNIMTKKIEIYVITSSAAYFDRLGDCVIPTIFSPFYFLFGAVFFLIPGFGTMLGAMLMGASVEAIPIFFKVLFNGPIYEEYILE